MKTVAIIYEDRDNQEAIFYLKNQLESMFEHYIEVVNYYANELPADFIIPGDAFLIVSENMLYTLKGHISDYSKIVLMKRTICSAYLHELMEIPPDTPVLLVNDCYRSVLDTVYVLYELGLNHLLLVPYDPGDGENPKYRECTLSITPNEPRLVPGFIKKIVNIGYREISVDTLLNLMDKLQLNFDQPNRNLARHIKSTADPSPKSNYGYFNDFIKNQVMNTMANASSLAMLILNDNFELIFSNDKASELFHIKSSTVVYVHEVIGDRLTRLLRGEVPSATAFSIRGEQYFISKMPLMIMDEIIGYYITLQNEKDLRDIEVNAKNMLEKKGLFAKYHFKDIIHVSEPMVRCIQMAKTVALTNHTVLIHGESGTGKELIAQSIHNYSPRKDQPFVAVNCAALPESLLESELFGYENGAFTGARKNGRLGLFEQANGGTIFLDEIGDVSLRLQSQLLRVLQEKQLMRIGGDRMIDVDTRVVAATNKDLSKEVELGTFRSDLFYRLNVITLHIVPLRERKDDILPLMKCFLGGKYSQLTDLDKTYLQYHDWPGNIRELESAAIHYSTLSFLPKYLERVDLSRVSQNFCDNKLEYDADDDLERRILKIILNHTQSFHGIGRVQIGVLLRGQNIRIGDGKLRQLVKSMQDKGWVVIGKGREGTKITQEGMKTLNQTAPMPSPQGKR